MSPNLSFHSPPPPPPTTPWPISVLLSTHLTSYCMCLQPNRIIIILNRLFATDWFYITDIFLEPGWFSAAAIITLSSHLFTHNDQWGKVSIVRAPVSDLSTMNHQRSDYLISRHPHKWWKCCSYLQTSRCSVFVQVKNIHCSLAATLAAFPPKNNIRRS